MPSLPTSLHLAVIGDDVILLDLAADRYRRLAPHLAAALRQALCTRVPLAPNNHAALVRTGILTETGACPSLATARAPAPARDYEEFAGRAANISAARAAALLARAHLELKRLGLQAALARAARRAGPLAPAPDRASAIAQGFAAARRPLPFAPRCLRDSLALHALLCARAVQSQLIIGVTARPFSAHCWVQADTVVLSGSRDSVAPFTPILVL